MSIFVAYQLAIPQNLKPKYTGFVQMLSENVILDDNHVFVYQHDYGPVQIMDENIDSLDDPRGWRVAGLRGSTIEEVRRSRNLPNSPFSVWWDADKLLHRGERWANIRVKVDGRSERFTIDLHNAINWDTYRGGNDVAYQPIPPVEVRLEDLRYAAGQANAIRIDGNLAGIQFDPEDYVMPPWAKVLGKKKPMALKPNAFHSQPAPLP